MTTAITIAYGDGKGPAIMEEVLLALRQTSAAISIATVDLGLRVYNMGSKTGILPYAWESLKRTGLLLKAPTIYPALEGYIDVSAAICQEMGLDISHRTLCHDKKQTPMASVTKNDNLALFESATGDDAKGLYYAAGLLLEHIGQPDAAKELLSHLD